MKYLFFIMFFTIQNCALCQSANFDKKLYYAYVSNKMPLRIKFLTSKLNRMESLLYEQFDNFTNDINILVLGKKDTLRIDTLYHISSWIPMITIKDEVCDITFANILYHWHQKAKKGIIYNVKKPCTDIVYSNICTTDIILEWYFGLSLFCRIEFVEKNSKKIPIEVLEVIKKDLDTLLAIKTKFFIINKNIDDKKLLNAIIKWKY